MADYCSMYDLVKGSQDNTDGSYAASHGHGDTPHQPQLSLRGARLLEAGTLRTSGTSSHRNREKVCLNT